MSYDENKNVSSSENLRPELIELFEREKYLWDENRTTAIEKLHARGQRSARENIADLLDEDSFLEYGSLAVAARRTIMSMEELMEKTPADGVITGLGSVNRKTFGEENSQCIVISYDQSVYAGTQGNHGHRKTDRMLELADRMNLPVIIFASGGGGRPGDVDRELWYAAALCYGTWARLGKLSGKVPTIAIMSRYCFAGNAALVGCCDVVIATKDSSCGMGGPVMIEGGGMGKVEPQDVGPTSVQTKNGVIDILVENEEEAVAVAKKYLSYFQGPLDKWEVSDQKLLRNVLPESKRRVYDVRRILQLLADKDSVLELRKDFGPGIVTALVRIEGKPMGIIANDVKHKAGAIDADGCDKYARFMQLCNAHRIPILNLVDCPGFMVGVDAEAEATVRHSGRLYNIASHLKVPHFTILMRAAYGLGAIAMGFGDWHSNAFIVAWPTAMLGSMGVEGSIKLGFKEQLEAIKDPEERQKYFDDLLIDRNNRAKPFNAASTVEIDAVIDPARTREWIIQGLRSSAAMKAPKDYSGNTYVDAW